MFTWFFFLYWTKVKYFRQNSIKVGCPSLCILLGTHVVNTTYYSDDNLGRLVTVVSASVLHVIGAISCCLHSLRSKSPSPVHIQGRGGLSSTYWREDCQIIHGYIWKPAQCSANLGDNEVWGTANVLSLSFHPLHCFSCGSSPRQSRLCGPHDDFLCHSFFLHLIIVALWSGRFVPSPLFVYSVTYLCWYGLTAICFIILWVIASIIIMLLKLFRIWQLRTLPVSPCVAQAFCCYSGSSSVSLCSSSGASHFSKEPWVLSHENGTETPRSGRWGCSVLWSAAASPGAASEQREYLCIY